TRRAVPRAARAAAPGAARPLPCVTSVSSPGVACVRPDAWESAGPCRPARRPAARPRAAPRARPSDGRTARSRAYGALAEAQPTFRTPTTLESTVDRDRDRDEEAPDRMSMGSRLA